MTGNEAAAWTLAGSERARMSGFRMTVCLATPDLLFTCTAAFHEQHDDHHFVWTEHYGDFFVHQDEVLVLHVTETP